MSTDINVHIGKRLRSRRRLLGLTQQQVSDSVGLKPQQIQRYENATSHLSARLLWSLSQSLEVPTTYFYDGLEGSAEHSDKRSSEDILARKETQDLIRAYYSLDERPRRRLLNLARSLSSESMGLSEASPHASADQVIPKMSAAGQVVESAHIQRQAQAVPKSPD